MGESGDLPAAIIITVGALEKVSRKYGDFAFRLVNSDAGVAYSQLLLAAEHQRVRAAKINVRLGPEMADRLSLRFPTELPTMAVGLYDSKISLDSRLNRSFENYVIPSKSFWTAAEAFYGLDYHDVAQIQTERSDSFNTAYTDKLYCPVQATLVQPEPTSIVLPRPSSRRTTLGEALLRRKSIRSFSDRAVSLEDISSVLNYASSSHRSGRRDKTECKGMISYTILASRVLRTADGVYKYQPEVHQLVKQKPSLSKEQTNSLFIQEGPANAPVIIWLSGRFAQVTLDDGAHGYHQMLQKAGEVAHRLSLAALACGLDGCIIAGIVTAKARALLGIDGLTSLSLLAFIMGYRD
jgi:SagB-type dehydrogenase family enzyme